MEQKTITVVFNINENYLPYCAVTMASILKNASSHVFFDFCILSIEHLGNAAEQIKISGYENYKIRNITVDVSTIKNLHLATYGQKHVTIDAYLRCYIPLIFNNIDKCIYLDVDLVLNTDIERLYDIDLKDYYAGAVVETNYYAIFTPSLRKECRDNFIKKYDIKNEFYFNSAVIIFNLKKIRDDEEENLIIDTAKTYRNGEFLLFPDQDFITIAYQGNNKGKMMPIDVRWNPFQIPRLPSDNLYIIHWCGGNKPWKNFNVPHIKIFLEYAKLTQFYPKIRDTLLEAVEDKLDYLNSKLLYKKYVRRLKLFDVRIFGKEVFPKTAGRCRRKIDDFMRQKNERKLYLDYLMELKAYLNEQI